ncbi:hypothetical protein PG996_010295 [Apiospora saccharicola]|uniref:Ferredoxin n=1 Tax=Apiospora saccharicola TaxID=335842 RepID=A0ABR1UQM4_9PEZI
MTIKLKPQADRGCDCGKPTGLFSKETIPDASRRPHTVAKDETGRARVQCATLLASVMDPGGPPTEYRRAR